MLWLALILSAAAVLLSVGSAAFVLVALVRAAVLREIALDTLRAAECQFRRLDGHLDDCRCEAGLYDRIRASEPAVAPFRMAEIDETS